jgi:hypothetical protein
MGGSKFEASPGEKVHETSSQLVKKVERGRWYAPHPGYADQPSPGIKRKTPSANCLEETGPRVWLKQ